MHIPYPDRERVLSVDPGTTHTGFAIVEKDLSTGEIHVPMAFTVHRKDLVRNKPFLSEQYEEREVAVMGYSLSFRNLLLTWEPTVVAVETSYMERFPQAFKALNELSISFIRETMSWDPTVPYKKVTPSAAKVAMGVKGNSSDKDHMRQALFGMPGVWLPQYASALDEHAVDAICIGLWAHSGK